MEHSPGSDPKREAHPHATPTGWKEASPGSGAKRRNPGYAQPSEALTALPQGRLSHRDFPRLNLRCRANQGDLFIEEWRKTFKVIPKLPFKFYYKFEDADGRSSKLRILDWEIGALFWNCLRRDGDEAVACEKVRTKYLDEYVKTDLHLFLGTTQQYHQVAPNHG